MGEVKRVKLDTEPPFRIAEEVLDVLQEVRDYDSSGPITVEEEDGRDRRNDPEKARIARELLRTAELANLLSAELHQLYWQLKGNDDPRWTT